MNKLPYFDIEEVNKLRAEGLDELSDEFQERFKSLVKWRDLSPEESARIEERAMELHTSHIEKG